MSRRSGSDCRRSPVPACRQCDGDQSRRCSLILLRVASDSAAALADSVWADSPPFMGRPHAARQTVGCYRIHFQDGAPEDVPLRHDEHLTRWKTRFGERSIMPYRADPVWQGKTSGAAPLTIWQYEWIDDRRRPVPAIDLIAGTQPTARLSCSLSQPPCGVGAEGRPPCRLSTERIVGLSLETGVRSARMSI